MKSFCLKSGDVASLERIYADDYLLVRPNGATFGKKEILADLRHHSMRFTSFEVNDVLYSDQRICRHFYGCRPERRG